MQAKLSMRGAYPHPMLVTLVYVLVTSGLSWLISFFVTNPFVDIAKYLNAGYDPAVVMQHFFSGGKMLLFIFLTILLSLYSSVMSFGYTSYTLRLARGEQPGYRNLLDGFAMAGKVILTGILTALFIFAWELAVLVPVYIMLIIIILLFESRVLAFLLVLVLIFGAIPFLISITYRYRLTYYFLLDYPELSPLEAITQSKLSMKGRKWSLFVLDLSFIGWALLVPFTLGILGLWLNPYMMTTQANFYDTIARQIQDFPGPQSGPDGLDGFNTRK